MKFNCGDIVIYKDVEWVFNTYLMWTSDPSIYVELLSKDKMASVTTTSDNIRHTVKNVVKCELKGILD